MIYSHKYNRSSKYTQWNNKSCCIASYNKICGFLAHGIIIIFIRVAEHDHPVDDDLHHVHGLVELRWLLCRKSFICHCQPHRSTANLAGVQSILYHPWSTMNRNYPLSILMNYILVSGRREGWDLPWHWLVWKRRQCQQRSNQRLVLNCLYIGQFSQVTSYVLPLRWALWWLPTSMWSELLPPTSSLPGDRNIEWFGHGFF